MLVDPGRLLVWVAGMDADSLELLRAGLRDVPDFPKPGIVFKDVMPLLANPKLMKLAMLALEETAGGQRVDKVVGIDARGFIFAAVVADHLGAGFISVRKKGKLPGRTIGTSYDLEYGSASVEMQADAISPGDRVMIVDDVLATGGTAAAALSLIAELGGEVVAASFFIELGFLDGRARLPAGVPVHSIIVV